MAIKSITQSKPAVMLLLLALATLLNASCGKDSNKENGATDDLPRTNVPAELADKNWHLGNVVTFFSGNFWADQRSYIVGNTANGQRYRFTPNGYCEFYNYFATNPGCGFTQRYAWFKGTVEFKGDRFTFYAAEGRKKLANDCRSSDNYDRAATQAEKEDMKKTYRWELKTGPAGDKILTLYDINGAYPDAPIEYTIKP